MPWSKTSVAKLKTKPPNRSNGLPGVHPGLGLGQGVVVSFVHGIARALSVPQLVPLEE